MAPTPEATAASPAKRTRKPRSKPTKRYPTDVTDAQWALIEPLLPPPATRGRAEKHPRREIVNAILYLDRAGFAWRLLPRCLVSVRDSRAVNGRLALPAGAGFRGWR